MQRFSDTVCTVCSVQQSVWFTSHMEQRQFVITFHVLLKSYKLSNQTFLHLPIQFSFWPLASQTRSLFRFEIQIRIQIKFHAFVTWEFIFWRLILPNLHVERESLGKIKVKTNSRFGELGEH